MAAWVLVPGTVSYAVTTLVQFRLLLPHVHIAL